MCDGGGADNENTRGRPLSHPRRIVLPSQVRVSGRLAPIAIAPDRDVTLPRASANSANTTAHAVWPDHPNRHRPSSPCVSSIPSSQPPPPTTPIEHPPSPLYHRRQHVRPARHRPLSPAHGSAHSARCSSPRRPHHLPQLQLREPQAVCRRRGQRVQP